MSQDLVGWDAETGRVVAAWSLEEVGEMRIQGEAEAALRPNADAPSFSFSPSQVPAHITQACCCINPCLPVPGKRDEGKGPGMLVDVV